MYLQQSKRPIKYREKHKNKETQKMSDYTIKQETIEKGGDLVWVIDGHQLFYKLTDIDAATFDELMMEGE